jgi:hypothetical protein
VTSGWGADGAIRLGDALISGGWATYWVSFDGQPRVGDWTQQRGYLGITHVFGNEPVADRGGYP